MEICILFYLYNIINIIISITEEKNKKIEPLKPKNSNILEINKIKNPENKTEEKKLFNDNNILFCLFL